MLLNFGDRTRTGAFSMIWPLTRKVRADWRSDSLVMVSTFWKSEMALVLTHSHDGDGSEGFSPIDLRFHSCSLLTFLQNAVSKSWRPVALSGLEVFGLNPPGFQLVWHGSWAGQLDKWVHQLVSQVFCSYRINLSPFTKDFRGQEAKIEPSSIFLRLPFWKLLFCKKILTRRVDCLHWHFEEKSGFAVFFPWVKRANQLFKSKFKHLM